MIFDTRITPCMHCMSMASSPWPGGAERPVWALAFLRRDPPP